MIEKRVANSAEMQKNIKTIRKMSSGMGFDENMGSINWKTIRFISNIGYMFMPKEKGVIFKKHILNDRKCMIAVPEKETSSYIIMYIHGGGGCIGKFCIIKRILFYACKIWRLHSRFRRLFTFSRE